MKSKSSSLLPASYLPLLTDLKARVRASQVKAAIAVNRELILLYWHIGRAISLARQAGDWGANIVERLAKDLAAEFPELNGFSYTNVKRMRAFAEAYGAIEISPQPVGQLTESKGSGAFGSQAVGRMPGKMAITAARHSEDGPPEPLSSLSWGSNILLLERLKDPATRLWYARKALEHGWSRAVLTVQIESRLHERSGKAITNFEHTLPPAQSDMAREVLKDPYTFDFLTLGEAAHERDLELGLVEHVQKLLLEMGAGFAFVGRQVNLEVGDEDFYLDLLFYHLRLRCFVVVDLKMKPFEPEFAGKMNFYLSAVDEQMRHEHDAPTIGLLLCKDARNKLKVEYALRDMKKPIGVAEWQTRLVEALPKNLRGSLPSIEDIERELNQQTRKLSGKKTRP